MTKIYIPSKGPEFWKEFLAEPEKQWRKGYSARSLAYCWEEARGFPKSVADVFASSAFQVFHNTEFLLGIPEHKVVLPGKGWVSIPNGFVIEEFKFACGEGYFRLDSGFRMRGPGMTILLGMTTGIFILLPDGCYGRKLDIIYVISDNEVFK